MTNNDVLRLPDVIRALQCWWDETRSWQTGTSSGVVADLLEDHGFCDADVLHWMRRTGAEGLQKICEGGFRGVSAFSLSAGVFGISRGTTTAPEIRRMLDYLYTGHDPHRAFGYEYRRDVRIILSEEDGKKAAASPEIYDMFRATPTFLNWFSNGVTVFPAALYGCKMRLTSDQPEGIVTAHYGNTSTIARVW